MKSIIVITSAIFCSQFALTAAEAEYSPPLTWIGGKKAVWSTDGTIGWADGAIYEDGDSVLFNKKGTVSIRGYVAPCSIVVDATKSLTFKTKYNKKTASYSGCITGNTALIKRGTGTLTLNADNDFSGGIEMEAGTLKAKNANSFGTGLITLSGGNLYLSNKAVDNAITLCGSAGIRKGKKYTGSFTLESGELLKGSILNIRGTSSLLSGCINGTLLGSGEVLVTGDVVVGKTGKIQTDKLIITGLLSADSRGLEMNKNKSSIEINQAELVSAGTLTACSMNLQNSTATLCGSKGAALTLKGALNLMNKSTLQLNGNLSAESLLMQNSLLFLKSEKLRKIKFSHAGLLQDSDIYANANVQFTNLGLTNSQLYLYDASVKKKSANLTCKGMLNMDSGAAITLSGKLYAYNLQVNSGSQASLSFTSDKFYTIKVKNNLTLYGKLDLNLCCNLQPGKKVKLFTFKKFYPGQGDLLSVLGLDKAGVELTINSKNVTMRIIDVKLWDAYVAENKEDAADNLPEELLLKAKHATVATDPLLRKAADTLVQSTWGTVNASRAFGDTIAARGAHATLLAEGKGAAWLSVMGGSSRISTDGDRNGADFTLSGAAFGVEGRVTEKSTLGVAIGNSWGKVSTFSAFPVDQDSMHIGIYGNHTLTESLTLSWMATHTRTESELNMLGLPYEWAQDALQLDARLTWATAISDKTTLRVFGGLQYLATDSGESNGLSTGSVQNLRGELGIGASHKCSDSTLVFGELSFVGDMVRNNPTADLGGMRLRGSNPGRAGINLSVGAVHRLSDDWSLNASYSFELMQNVTSHSLNVGASYSF